MSYHNVVNTKIKKNKNHLTSITKEIQKTERFNAPAVEINSYMMNGQGVTAECQINNKLMVLQQKNLFSQWLQFLIYAEN